jgi:hypothetical protein
VRLSLTINDISVHADEMPVLVPVILGVLFIACSVIPLRAGEVVPDFKLLDLNPNSVRFATSVSPRDYLLQVSGYYFGAAG